jgi:protein required for attachment to host cells
LAQEETAHERDEHMFALHLADVLDKNRMAGVFDMLVIIAGPKLLGKLRSALTEPTRKLVKAELDKDLIDPTEADLRSHLQGLARV